MKECCGHFRLTRQREGGKNIFSEHSDSIKRRVEHRDSYTTIESLLNRYDNTRIGVKEHVMEESSSKPDLLESLYCDKQYLIKTNSITQCSAPNTRRTKFPSIKTLTSMHDDIDYIPEYNPENMNRVVPIEQLIDNDAKNKKKLQLNIDPIALGLLPTEYWKSSCVPLLKVFTPFFPTRSTKKVRFEHKLWNALVLTRKYPDLLPIIGVSWVSQYIIKVNRVVFGNLLNVTRPSAALFNSQGLLLTHGFREVSKKEAIQSGVDLNLIDNVDESVIRLFTHTERFFGENSKKEDIAKCRWSKRKPETL